MFAVTPLTRKQYVAGYREAVRQSFSGRGMKIFTGVCPVCGKPTGGSAKPVYTTNDGSLLLTDAEAQGRDDVRYAYVGAACLKRIGFEYEMKTWNDSVCERFSLMGDGRIVEN